MARPVPAAGYPSVDDRIYAPYKIGTLVAAAAEEGLGVDVLLQGTGIAAASLADPALRTSSRQFAQACGNAIAAGASPELPFRMGQRMRVSSYGMYGLALLTFKTAREGLHFAMRFHRLASPSFVMNLHEEGDKATWVFSDLLGLAPGSALHRFLMEFQIGLQMSLGRDIWQDRVRADVVTLCYPRPAHAPLYEEALGCPVLFDQPRDASTFDAHLLDTELPQHNPIMAAMVQALSERLLAQSGARRGTVRQVYEILAGHPGQFPPMGRVAQTLNTTTRTLRRRLQDEGTSFQQVLDEVRASLAREYLARTRLANEDIAAALGFSDAANFRAAFRRWTGGTPSAYRRASGGAV